MKNILRANINHRHREETPFYIQSMSLYNRYLFTDYKIDNPYDQFVVNLIYASCVLSWVYMHISFDIQN